MWHKMVPANTGGGRKRALKTARMGADGQFSMSHAVADMLGSPDKVIVEVEPDLQQIRLTPTTPDNRGGYTLSGGGNASYRIRAKEIVNRWPHLVGEYEPRKHANALVFIQTGGTTT